MQAGDRVHVQTPAGQQPGVVEYVYSLAPGEDLPRLVVRLDSGGHLTAIEQARVAREGEG